MQLGRADVGAHVHLHAVDDGEEVFALQVESAHRLGERPQLLRRHAAVQRVDVPPPLRELGQARLPVSMAIGHVVDRAAKSVDGEHGAALLRWQHAHCGVKGTAGNRGFRLRVREHADSHRVQP